MTAAPDLPAPGFQSAEDRLQISRRFLIHAREELEKGRRLQAGNKAYGAVVQPLKVIAEQRGWKHHSNDNIRDIGSMVAWEYQNHDLSELFGEVYHVGHENYYENQHGQEELESLLDDLEEMLPTLIALTTEPPRPVTIDSNNRARRLQRLTGRSDLAVGDFSDVGFSNRHREGGDESGGGA